jgi:hypothetical protein
MLGSRFEMTPNSEPNTSDCFKNSNASMAVGFSVSDKSISEFCAGALLSLYSFLVISLLVVADFPLTDKPFTDLPFTDFQ